ncbi:MAG: hypothetical protein N2167_08300 [Flavobacteriales bacterium]|nr:hypothetical protein [Flavobacteriales bacterium]
MLQVSNPFFSNDNFFQGGIRVFRYYAAWLQPSCTKAARAYCQSPARLSAANLHPVLHTASPAAPTSAFTFF